MKKDVCAGPGCLEVLTHTPGKRPREFCGDACRKAASRVGIKETIGDKLTIINGQKLDILRRFRRLHEELAALDEAWYTLTE